MWGNTIGWAISAVIVVATVGLIVLLERSIAISPPTALTADPRNMARLALPTSPRTVAGFVHQPCDAGPLYRQALEAYLADPQPVDAFILGGRRFPNHRAFDALREATPCIRATIFADDPQLLIIYDPEKPQLEALRMLGKALISHGLRQMRRDTEDARRSFEAAFSLGASLYEERLIFDQFRIGLELMDEAAYGLAQLPIHQAEHFEAFRETTREYRDRHAIPIWTAISTIDPRLTGDHAGDLFVLAQRAEERMWRIEATLALGRHKFQSPRRADQETARRLIRELRDDADPAVRIAARLADELTVEQYRHLGW